MKFFRKAIGNYLPYLLLLLLSAFPFLINSSFSDSNNGFFNLTDFPVPFDLPSLIKQYSYTWNPNIGTGIPNIYINGNVLINYYYPLFVLTKIGFSLITAEKIYFSLILFFTGTAVFLFLNKYFSVADGINGKISSLLAASFYMFSNVVGQKFIGVPHFVISLGLFPLLILLLNNLISSKEIKILILNSILVSVTISLLAVNDMTLTYIFLITSFIFLLTNIILNYKKIFWKRIIASFGLIAFLLLILNAYLWLPVVSEFINKEQFPISISENVINASINKDTFEKNAFFHNSPFDFLRLFTSPGDFDGVTYPSLIGLYYRLPFDVLSFLALIIVGLFACIKNKQNNNKYLLITVLGILGMLFLFGPASPLGFWKIHQILFYNFPGWTALRNYTKWNILVLFWYTCLLFSVSNYLLEIFQKKSLLKILSIMILILFIIQACLPWIYKDFAGNFEYSSLPDYYFEAKNWIKEQKSDFKIMVLPQYSYSELYEWGPKFRQTSLYNYFFNKPVFFSPPGGNTGTGYLTDRLDKYEIGNPAGYLKYLGIRYLILRKDLIPGSLSQNFQSILNGAGGYLASNGFKLIKKFGGKLEVYESPVNNYPMIFSPESIYYFEGNNKNASYLFDLPTEKTNQIFLSDNNKKTINNINHLIKATYFQVDPIRINANVGTGVNYPNDLTEYSIDIPRKGGYSLFLRPDAGNGVNFLDSKMFDKNSFSINIGVDQYNASTNNDYWWNFGSIELEPGVKRFRINSPLVNIIDDKSWKTPENTNNIQYQQILRWLPENYYFISFDHKNKGFNIVLKEWFSKGFFKYKTEEKNILNENINPAENWQKFETVVKSDPDTLGAIFAVQTQEDQAEIRNLIISPILRPHFFIKSPENDVVTGKVKLLYKEINPAKFSVEIENSVVNDFILVLNQTYDKSWSVEIDGKEIPKENHYLANGFANAWLIKPEYFITPNQKIEIFFYPQKFLNIGKLITFSSIFIISAFIVFLLFKTKKPKEYV